jgi:T5SS/PEP-CTERM-associated repeat protein
LLVAATLAATPLVTQAAISSSGNVTPSPPQTAGADPVIGVTDLGRFTITPSSVVTSDQVVIGQQLTGIGYAVVSGFDTGTGSGAVWTTNNMVVGSAGTGTLEVLDGALVTVDFAGNPGSGDLTIGLSPDSLGTVVVSGRGSLLRIGDDTNIGFNPAGPGGSGTLVIRDEGLVIATNDAATGADVITVGVHGRIELASGRLRGEVISNSGTITGHGRIDNEQTISNFINGRVSVGPGQRLVINAGTTGGLGFDNDGEVNIVGGEIEFFEQFTNSNQAAKVTLRDGATVHFPAPITGFGFDSTGGVLATTAGVNDIFGAVRIQGASSRIVVAGNSTAVFHDPVTNSGATIEVFPGSTPVFLQGLTTTAAAVLAMHVTDPAAAPANVVEVAGAAQLDGNLQITLSGGYAPRIGDRVPILQAGQVTGAFTSATIPGPAGSGIQFHPVYTLTDVDVLVAGAGDKTWGVDANGLASLASNWLGGVAPNAVGDRVAFTTMITADRTVAVDAPFTAGSIYFDDNNNYLVQGAGSITLDVATGDARIEVKNVHGAGQHTIAAPLTLNDNTFVDVAAGASLALTGQTTAAPGVTFTKTGLGPLSVRNVRAADLTIKEGRVSILNNGGPDGASAVNSLAIAASASLDLTDNALVLDYATPPGPLLDVRSQIVSGAITSSTAAADPSRAIGYGESSTILGPAGGTFVGQSVDDTAVLVRVTLKGDTNLDGAVDFNDLARLAQNYNITDRRRIWTQGDFTYDGNVDFNDLAAMAQNYNTSLPATVPGASAGFNEDFARAVASVPEPSLSFIAVIACAFARRKRRDPEIIIDSPRART